jgi:hypothetical protein
MPIARDYAYALMAALTSLVVIGAVQAVSEAAQNDKNTASSKASDASDKPIIEPSSQPSAVNVRCSAGYTLRTTLSTGSQAAMTVSCAPA